MPESGPFSSVSHQTSILSPSSSTQTGEDQNISLSVEAQKALVKSSIKSALQENASWAIISSSWFRRWKKYVAYEDMLDHHRPQEEIDSFYPGPIDNADILLNEFELKKNLFEGIDYVFLPEPTAKMLHDVFGGDNLIIRKVVSKSTHYQRNLQIELYPIKFRVYLQSDVAEQENPQPVRIEFLSSSLTVSDALEQVCNSLHLRQENCRVWIRKDADDEDDSDSEADTQSGRKMTPDVTDVDGSWRYLRNLDFGSLEQFNMLSVDIMIEQKAVHPRTGQTYWPKDQVLHEWKYNLRRGDMVDARDQYGTWYESVVDSVNVHTKTLTIHFKGWSKKFDRDISEKEVVTEIAPLYTRTENWREKLKIYDRVDFTKHNTLDQGRKWIPAYVMSIDLENGLLKVKYRDDSLISEVDGVDLYGESICQMGTHVKTAVANFAMSPVTGSRVATVSAVDYAVTPSTSSLYTSSATTYGHSNYGSSRYGSSWSSRSHSVGKPDEVGVVGLYNLGNTCFMNSMLQCLSNTKTLTDCFLTDTYASQINTENPLGHGGRIATSYARLMKEMWSGKYVAVSPDDFKRTIGEFAPQFSGYQQQDSQELMLFLLDGLHEDLNRVVKKPFVEKIESKGRDDDLISREAWRRFLLRNNSELVDKCFGQLRSHVTCTSCGYQSVTFDEYSSLSLPLPIKNTVEVEVVVYPLPLGSVPVKLTLDVDGLLSVKDFKNLVVSKLHLRPEQKKRKTIDEIPNENRDPDSSGDFVMVNSETNSLSHSTDSPDGYDSDLAELGDKEALGGPTIVISSSGKKNPRNDEMDQENAAGGYFHICEAVGSTNGQGGRIFKTFEDRVLVKELARLREPCLMIELHHNAPATIPYTYAGSHQSNASIRFVDILMGTISKSKSYYTSYATGSFELNGPPHRLSYLSASTTYGQIQEMMWAIMRPYLHGDSPYQSYSPSDSSTECPYDVYLTNSYGSTSKGVVTAKPTDPFNISSYDALICVWRDNVLKDHLNDAAINAITDLTAQNTANATERSGHVNVLDCLNKFIEREQMPPEETWYCPNCKQHLAPIKKFDVWTAPDILIIHLKRFQYVPGVYFVHREKLTDLIEFPITGLDLTQYVKSRSSWTEDAPPIYDLYAVSEHIGGMGGGHYTATAMNPINGKWYNFNDSSTHEVAAEEAVSSKAYVLFYKRRTGSLKWAGAVPLPEPLTD